MISSTLINQISRKRHSCQTVLADPVDQLHNKNNNEMNGVIFVDLRKKSSLLSTTTCIIRKPSYYRVSDGVIIIIIMILFL